MSAPVLERLNYDSNILRHISSEDNSMSAPVLERLNYDVCIHCFNPSFVLGGMSAPVLERLNYDQCSGQRTTVRFVDVRSCIGAAQLRLPRLYRSRGYGHLYVRSCIGAAQLRRVGIASHQLAHLNDVRSCIGAAQLRLHKWR